MLAVMGDWIYISFHAQVCWSWCSTCKILISSSQKEGLLLFVDDLTTQFPIMVYSNTGLLHVSDCGTSFIFCRLLALFSLMKSMLLDQPGNSGRATPRRHCTNYLLKWMDLSRMRYL
jgi:hypothetical protein